MEITPTSNYYSRRKITNRTSLNSTSFKSKFVDKGGVAHFEEFLQLVYLPLETEKRFFKRIFKNPFKKDPAIKKAFGKECKFKTFKEAFDNFSKELINLWEISTNNAKGSLILEKGSIPHTLRIKLETEDGTVLNGDYLHNSVEVQCFHLIQGGKPNISRLLTKAADIACHNEEKASGLDKVYKELSPNLE